MKKIILMFLLTSLAIGQSSTLYFTDGKTLEGEIVEQSKDGVIFKVADPNKVIYPLGSIGYGQSVPDTNSNLIKRIGAHPFPLRFTLGVGIEGDLGSGSIFTMSYGFSKGIKINSYRNLYKSFTLYPEIALGVLGVNKESTSDHEFAEPSNEFTIIGMIEGHRRWEMENMKGTLFENGSLFLGAGIGGYDVGRQEFNEDGSSPGFIKERGAGLIVSTGVRLSGQSWTGGISLYRSPGLEEIVTIANVNYQPKNYKEAIIVGAGYLASWLLLALIFPGS